MSIKLMSMVFYADIPNLKYKHHGKRVSGKAYSKIITVTSGVAKSILLALADHANDDGFGAYPSVARLLIKTSLTKPTIINGLRALRENGFTDLDGVSRRGTNDYTINKDNLLKIQNKMSDYYNEEVVKPLDPPTPGGKATLPVVVKPLYQGGKATLPESSITISKSSDSLPKGKQTDPFAGLGKPEEPETSKSKPKTEYVKNMELLEGEFATVRGCALPDWEDNPKAANRRWRTPLAKIWRAYDRDTELVKRGIKAVTIRQMNDGLTFDAPDGIKKSLRSWLIDNKNGNGSGNIEVEMHVAPEEDNRKTILELQKEL